jgi:hypothetical protein
MLFEDAEGDEEDSADTGSVSDGRMRRPMTRSVKPRILFPQAHAGKDLESMDDEDEEAVTDIEDHVLPDADDVMEPETPMVKGTPDTPATPRFAPTSPPATGRVTRFGNKTSAERSPRMARAGSEGKNSPLGFRLSKGSMSKTGGHKRPAASLDESPAKRARA